MDAISETTHHGVSRAREGGRRLIQLAEGRRSPVELCPAPYVVQTSTAAPGWVHGAFFFSEFACDALGSVWADSDLLTPDSSRLGPRGTP